MEEDNDTYQVDLPVDDSEVYIIVEETNDPVADLNTTFIVDVPAPGVLPEIDPQTLSGTCLSVSSRKLLTTG